VGAISREIHLDESFDGGIGGGGATESETKMIPENRALPDLYAAPSPADIAMIGF
jgi:hypothetical protein